MNVSDDDRKILRMGMRMTTLLAAYRNGQRCDEIDRAEIDRLFTEWDTFWLLRAARDVRAAQAPSLNSPGGASGR